MTPEDIECNIDKKLLELVRSNSKSTNIYPLISVRIATYNRAKLLTERAIPSVLKQTYQNFEIIIVGDHCTDNTEELIKRLNDKRIRFYNLPERGEYPIDPRNRWYVAGTVPLNRAIELCSGDWIAPLDDDDTFTEDHLDVLLSHTLKNNYELAYGKLQMEVGYNTGRWNTIGIYPPMLGQINFMATLYSSKLKFFKYDINAWMYNEPGDWNLIRRMMEAGVKMGFINHVVARHYEKRTQYSD
jgi:glycosyltransferase involved in cell wall biosynthesis